MMTRHDICRWLAFEQSGLLLQAASEGKSPVGNPLNLTSF